MAGSYEMKPDKCPDPEERTFRSRAARKTERPEALSHRRALRVTSTRAEKLIWSLLRGGRQQGYKFRRQHAIGPYIVDFACLKASLVIEIDGGYHDLRYEQDKSREACLNQEGFRVIRFWNEDVLTNLEGVAEAIKRAISGNSETK